MFKNILVAATLVFTMLTANVAFSHSSGHSEPPNNEQIVAKASRDLAVIVDNAEPVDGKVLGASWNKSITPEIHKKTFKHYVVSFFHAEEKTTVYILLNTQGAYLGANFDGNFKQLQTK